MTDKIKAAIFDLDGTLADSMRVWDNLLINFLKRYGYETPPDILREVAFMTMVQSSEYICRKFALPINPSEILQEWIDMVHECYAKEVPLKAGAKEFLTQLKANGVKIALATSCDSSLAVPCLKNNGIFDIIDVITYSDEVGCGKQSPEIYLECLRRLCCEAKDAVLFEDILVGMKAAQSIGLKTIIVEDKSAEADRELLKQGADRYILDFTELL